MMPNETESLTADNLLISYDYPHSLLMHILTIQKELKITNPNLLYEEKFLQEFEKRYADFPNELLELSLALKNQVIDGFFENESAKKWEKRVFLSVTITRLLHDLPEYEAVELIESLMYLFHWEMEFDLKRTWDVPNEEKAWFHCPTKIKDLYKESFEKSAKIYLEKQKDEKKHLKQTKIYRSQKPKKTDSINNKKQSTVSNDAISNVENPVETSHTIKTYAQDVTIDTSETLSRNISIVRDSVRIQKLTDEQYRQEIQTIQIKHENLMNLSLRKEIKKAKRGDNMAQMHLAEFYAEPGTKHTDYTEAVRWYAYASKKGNMKAKFEMGCIFDNEKIEGKNTKEYGICLFSELAKEGFPTAQYILGMKYFLGDTIEKDTDKSILWLKKAALQGIVEAQKQLGNIYLSLDREEAKKWFRKAASAGDTESMQKLRQI